jgi:hypothetical protein
MRITLRQPDWRYSQHEAGQQGDSVRAGTCIDPKTQIVQGKTVCVVSCQRSPEPVFLKWKGMEAVAFSSGAAPGP